MLFAAGEQGAHFEAYDPQTLLRRRNQLTYSSDFTKLSGAPWVATAVASVTRRADGVGDLVVPNTTNTAHHLSQSAASVGVSNVKHVRAKAGGYNFVAIAFSSGAAAAWFDLSSGATGTVVGGEASINAVDSLPGYYDCYFSVASTTTSLAQVFVCAANGATAFAGDGVKGAYLARAQVEWNTTVPSAYQDVTDWTTEYLAAALESIGMWQDAAGTTPVTVVEQPVGLWRDTKLGMATGPELVMNGTFAGIADGTAPTAVSAQWGVYGAPTTAEIRGERLHIVSPGPNNGSKLTIPTEVGASYRITHTYTGDGAPSVYLASDTSGATALGNTTTGAATVTATTSSITFFFRPNNNQAGEGFFDNISVKKLPGNHATQSGNTKRMYLSARYNMLTKTEQFDDPVWGKQSAGTGVVPVVTPNAGVDPRGGNTADRVVLDRGAGNTTADYSLLQQLISGSVSGSDYEGGIWLKSYTGATQTAVVYINTGAATQSVLVAVGNEWTKVSPNTLTANAANIALSVSTRGGAFSSTTPYGGDASLDLLVWGADLRTSDDAAKNIPAYQRVNTASDFDTDGFPEYERLDGVDDNQTASAGGGGTTGFLFCGAAQCDGAGTSRVLWSDMGTNTGYRVMVNSSNQLQLTAGDGAASTSVSTVDTVSALSTHVFTAWDDGVNLNVQIDNGAVASVARPSVAAGTSGFTIGSSNGAASGYFKGRIYSQTYRQADGGDGLRAKLKRYHAGKAGITL